VGIIRVLDQVIGILLQVSNAIRPFQPLDQRTVTSHRDRQGHSIIKGAKDNRLPAAARQAGHCHPLGIGMTHDVAATVAFLASEDARWITGIVLPLGWTPNYPIPESFIGDT
jgi:NAD(P)-dependent dehydrogenase (short-subunit alcohol dehydrogenase family)